MKPLSRRFASLGFVAALAAFIIGMAAQAGPGPKVIAWKTDFKKASAEAAKAKKPIFIDFYSEG